MQVYLFVSMLLMIQKLTSLTILVHLRYCHLIVLLCYQYIFFSHINSNSCLIVLILHPFLMTMRWIYQEISIGSNLRFGINFNNTDIQWRLFHDVRIFCRHVLQNGWFQQNITPVRFTHPKLSDIQC